MMIRKTALALALLTTIACGKNPAAPSVPESSVPNPKFISKVEVTFNSLKDHDPNSEDWVTFRVNLANPDGTIRVCTLQSTAIRPHGSDCPDVGSTVDKVAPFTFRAYLYNVWVNQQSDNPKHIISASEIIDLSIPQPFSVTGYNITVSGATDQEVKVIGSCSNCAYGQMLGLAFRVKAN